MTQTTLTDNEVDRIATQIVSDFRGLRTDETTAEFAVVVAKRAIKAYIEGTGGQVIGTQENLPELLTRANMDQFTFNTGVIRATCGSGRISVRSCSGRVWGDCVSLEFMREGDRGWFTMALSPARSRLLANLLIQSAEFHEATDPGMKCIDR